MFALPQVSEAHRGEVADAVAHGPRQRQGTGWYPSALLTDDGRAVLARCPARAQVSHLKGCTKFWRQQVTHGDDQVPTRSCAMDLNLKHFHAYWIHLEGRQKLRVRNRDV